MSGIPLPEFVKMVREAQAAFEASDFSTALESNERFSQWGYSLVVDNGRLRLENETAPKAAPAVVHDYAVETTMTARR